VWQFDEVFDQSHPIEGLRELVDPRLGDNYPIDHVFKVEDYSIYLVSNINNKNLKIQLIILLFNDIILKIVSMLEIFLESL